MVSRLRALRTAITTWWRGLDPSERVLYRAMGLLAVGGGLIAPALAFLIPGALLALVFFGFTFRRAE